MSAETRGIERINLSVDHIPTAEELTEAYKSNRHEPTILSQPLERYEEVIRTYPVGTKLAEFDEIAEAAAIGDQMAIIYEWLTIKWEANTIGFDTDATPSPDLPADRVRALEEWEAERNFMRPIEERLHNPTKTIDETLVEIDDSIRIIEGALAICGLEKVETPSEPNN